MQLRLLASTELIISIIYHSFGCLKYFFALVNKSSDYGAGRRTLASINLLNLSCNVARSISLDVSGIVLFKCCKRKPILSIVFCIATRW